MVNLNIAPDPAADDLADPFQFFVREGSSLRHGGRSSHRVELHPGDLSSGGHDLDKPPAIGFHFEFRGPLTVQAK